ncbi:hypothetical protein ACIBF1_35265 [Spirillospora sp. NPDC050679]
MAVQDTCRHCREPLPAPDARGGRPRKYCSDTCRWAFRRGLERRWRPATRLHERQTNTAQQRRHLRDQAEHLATAAGKLALDLREEDLAPASQQTGWKPGPIAGYTAARHYRP